MACVLLVTNLLDWENLILLDRALPPIFWIEPELESRVALMVETPFLSGGAKDMQIICKWTASQPLQLETKLSLF